jgi:hypothetical protein
VVLNNPFNLKIRRVMKKLFTLSILTLSFASFALFGIGEDKKDADNKGAIKEKTAEECEIPAFAKAIGHEDQWLLHNGCPPREKGEKEEFK